MKLNQERMSEAIFYWVSHTMASIMIQNQMLINLCKKNNIVPEDFGIESFEEHVEDLVEAIKEKTLKMFGSDENDNNNLN